LRRKEIRYEDLLNLIVKFFVKIITHEEEILSKEYIRNLNEIVEVISENNRIRLDKELVEICTSMGSFGNTVKMKRFSVYFCTCLLRVKKRKDFLLLLLHYL